MAYNNQLTQILTDALKSSEFGFFSLTGLKYALKKDIRKLFELSSNSNVDDIKEKVKPYAIGEVKLYYKNYNYILLKNLNIEETVLKYIEKNPNKSQLQVKNAIPIVDGVIIQTINSLIKEGKVFVDFNENSNYTPRLKIFQNQFSALKIEKNTEPDERSLFKKSYNDLIRGKRYVEICEIRRELGWERNRFDRLLEKLRDEDEIFLQPADTSTMDEQDVKDSFVDENNQLMIIVSWRK